MAVHSHGKEAIATAPRSGGGRRVRFRVRRQDTPTSAPRWEVFEVLAEPGANVISCLQLIAAHPVTVDGETTTPVVWDSNCLEEVCGACTMVINGKVRQSCSCLIDDYAPNEGDEITLEPMSKFPVVRDLFVDRQRMFNDLKKIKGWTPIDGTWSLGPGPRETPEKQAIRYKLSECMTCGCCLEACPQYLKENDFVGAMIFGQTRYFNEHPVGAVLKGERLEALMGPGGLNDCGQAQNCVKVCPKGIPLTTAIGAVGRQQTVHSLKLFFTGRE